MKTSVTFPPSFFSFQLSVNEERAMNVHHTIFMASISVAPKPFLFVPPESPSSSDMATKPASPYRKEKDGWMGVPRFGGWDQKAGGRTPDYSMVFNHARANRKQQRIDVSSSSLGHEKEFLNFPVPRAEQNSEMKKRSFFSCFSCGVKN